MTTNTKEKSKHLISIIRHRDGLKALLCHQETKFIPPDDIYSYNFKKFKPAVYQISTLPLEKLKGSLCPNKKRLLECHQKLQKVRKISDEVIQASIYLLEQTVPADDFFNLKSTGFTIPHEIVKPKPTAKNPRAFKGTKHKPPKKAIIKFQDIYMVLCNSTDYRLFLNEYSKTNPEPYFCKHFKGYEIQEKQKIGIDFFRFILPLMRDQGWSQAIKSQVITQQIEIFKNDDLLAATCFLLNKLNPSCRLQWLEFIVKTPPDIHLPLLSILSNSDITTKLPNKELLAGILKIYSQSDIKQVPRRLHIISDGFSQGDPLSYYLTGFELSDKYNHYLSPPDRVTFSAVDSDIIEKCLEKLPKDWERGLWAMNLWRSGAKVENFGNFLRGLLNSKINMVVFAEIIYIASCMGSYGDTQEAIETKWILFKGRLNSIVAQLKPLSPESLSKFGNLFDDLLAKADEPEQIKQNFDSFIQATLRFCQKGARKESSLATCIFNLVSFDVDISALPDRTRKCLDRECRSENDARLIAWGLYTMLKRSRDLTEYGLRECPGTLVNTCKTLGAINYVERETLLDEFNNDEIRSLEIDKLSPQKLREILHKTGVLETFNPFPKRFTQWINNEIELSEGQVQRAKNETIKKFPELYLHYLKQFALNRINKPIGMSINKKDEVFALQMLRDMSTNKRVLRKFLKAYAWGDAKFLLSHEKTRQWLQKNKAIDPTIWTNGITQSVQLNGKSITLSLEKEPLQVLKMGSYVGSCFGLGGSFSESAAAVLLDINKQVIYARNKNGKVLARQLLAISKAGKLVPYSVYPLNSPDDIRELFVAYDQEFASKLGLSLADLESESDEETEVEFILSQYCWDDGPWDLKTEKES